MTDVPEEPPMTWCTLLGRAVGWVLIGLVITGLLLAYSIPFLPVRGHRVTGIKADMHSVQLAAQSYVWDTAGQYPAQLDQLLPYLPGGDSAHGIAGNLPSKCTFIPITGDEISRSSDGKWVINANKIQKRIGRFDEHTRWIGYCGLGYCYAVVGGEGPRFAARDDGKPFILWDQLPNVEPPIR